MKNLIKARTRLRLTALSLAASLAAVATPAPAQHKPFDNAAIEKEMVAKFRPDIAKEAREKSKPARSEQNKSKFPAKPANR